MKTITSQSLINALRVDYFRELSTFGALSDKAIEHLLEHGCIKELDKGDILYNGGEPTSGFNVVLKGNLAFYKHCKDHNVLTRHFRNGEEGSFDRMIGLMPHSGTAIAEEKTIILEISHDQFFNFHIEHPTDFGILMINLARELSREIDILENLIGELSIG